MNKNKTNQFVGTGPTNNRTQTIHGVLTSQIETRDTNTSNYYCYAFFKLEGYEQEIPVIWKKQAKPNLKKGSLVELTGQWAQSNGDRPSFNCSDYKFIKEASPPTIPELQKEISSLLRPSLDKKKEWAETTDFLFKKQKELSDLEKISQFGEPYVKAYLLTKQVFYANYQAEHLPLADFDLSSYLARISSELAIAKRQMLATGWREVK